MVWTPATGRLGILYSNKDIGQGIPLVSNIGLVFGLQDVDCTAVPNVSFEITLIHSQSDEMRPLPITFKSNTLVASNAYLPLAAC
jgi:hypothetical protein